jgi:hypothetical protein
MTTLAAICISIPLGTFGKIMAVLVPWLLLVLAAAYGIWRWRQARKADQAVANSWSPSAPRGFPLPTVTPVPGGFTSPVKRP